MIEHEYQVNWLVDNLPAAMRYHRRGDNSYSYTNGFPVGLKRGNRYYVNNHVRIGLQYHIDPTEFRVPVNGALGPGTPRPGRASNRPIL